jgi:CheY-like chemotaxis protein
VEWLRAGSKKGKKGKKGKKALFVLFALLALFASFFCLQQKTTCPGGKILIDEPGVRSTITSAPILETVRNDMRVLIADEDPLPILESASSSRRGGVNILIADENPATLDFFSCLLEDRGFTILAAASGEAALQLLSPTMPLEERGWKTGSGELVMRSLSRRPIRLILLGDLMKPPIDGLDLIRRLRPYHIPVVVATSYGADYALLAKMAGAEVVIHKFADPTYLITTIEQAIKSHPPFPPNLELIR